MTVPHTATIICDVTTIIRVQSDCQEKSEILELQPEERKVFAGKNKYFIKIKIQNDRNTP